MDSIHISKLKPELPESMNFKATITLLWPYSTLARQFALLLAEPNFRLRGKQGHVKVHFSGPSAEAVAGTGVGIGDEMMLSLRGAKFVQKRFASVLVNTIDWELLYTQTIVAQMFRNGDEIANLDIDDVASTPALKLSLEHEDAISKRL
ncbi:hypothetical protein GQ44DRAFT_733550 [Phaeosphaeriaceae sp. PMI808]|nr:hypothetical protein GQ44DRAFT_733550 [Phaeosphaeriaceae sp. PMI808]